jgi:uncharacterized membrane protein YhaH (DUF805 family)
MEWMIMPFRRYADFSGRSRRMEYWMFQLLNLIVVGVLVALAISGLPEVSSSSYPGEDPTFGEPGVLFAIALGVGVLYWLFTFIPSLAVLVRRLHDTGKSGWWWFIQLIPLGSIVLLVFTCLEGDGYENAYGPDPKSDDVDTLRDMFR